MSLTLLVLNLVSQILIRLNPVKDSGNKAKISPSKIPTEATLLMKSLSRFRHRVVLNQGDTQLLWFLLIES